MYIFIKIKPKARENQVEKIDDTHFKVSVREAPVDDKANRALIRLLADYFHIPQWNFEIVSGKTSRNKKIRLLI